MPALVPFDVESQRPSRTPTRCAGGRVVVAAIVGLVATTPACALLVRAPTEAPSTRDDVEIPSSRVPSDAPYPLEPLQPGSREPAPLPAPQGPAARPRIVIGLRTAFGTNEGPEEDPSPIAAGGIDLEIAHGPVRVGGSLYHGTLLGEPAGADDWDEVHRFEGELSGITGAVRLAFDPVPRGPDDFGYGGQWRVAFTGHDVTLEGDVSLVFGTTEVWGDIGYSLLPTWEETRLLHLDVGWRDSAFGTAKIGLAMWMLTAKGNLGLSSSFVFDLGREWGLGVRAEGGHQGWILLGLWLERRVDL